MRTRTFRKHDALLRHASAVLLTLLPACSADVKSGQPTSQLNGGTPAQQQMAGTAGTAGASAAGAGAGSAAFAGASGRPVTAADDDDAGAAGAGGSVQPVAQVTAGAGGAAGKSAAAGKSGAAGSAGSTSPTAGTRAPAEPVTFSDVYVVLRTNCAGADCHINASDPGGKLTFPDKAGAYANLVNIKSVECPDERRVVPGDADKSVLVHSLARTRMSGCGADTPRMPDDEPKLNDATIQLVTDWVLAGAKND